MPRRIHIDNLAPAKKVESTGPALPSPAKNPILVGHGHDIHRLQLGGELILAGVEVSTEMSAIAHSDGDVAIHALVDALLGAAGLGDIGEHFPNTDEKWKGVASKVFFDEIWSQLRRAGYALGNCDLTILAEKPKLSPFKAAMTENLQKLFGGGLVNIKAGTNEGCDAVGRGEAIAAHAVVLLVASS